MKRETIPTSPQYSDPRQKPKSDTASRPVVGMMVLGVLAGAAAGFAASLFVLSQFDIQSQQIVIDTSAGSSSISQSISTLAPGVRERTVSVVGTDGQLLAQGVIATTDGWVITPRDVGEGEQLINARRQLLDIEQRVQDPFTGLFFLKVNQTGLPVVTWTNQDEVSLGLWGFVMQLSPITADQVLGRAIHTMRTAPAAEQSLLSLQDVYGFERVEGVVDGTPFVAQNSRVIGLVSGGNKIVPGPVIEQRLSYFIDHQAFKTLPNVSIKSLFFDSAEGNIGFLVTQSQIDALLVDDVITGVGGVELTKQDQLWAVLLEQEDSTVILNVLRQGEAAEVSLDL